MKPHLALVIAALASAQPTPLRAIPVCGEDGVVEHIRFVQRGDSFHPVARREGGERSLGGAVRGYVRQEAEFGSPPAGFPLAAAFERGTEGPGYAIWWKAGQQAMLEPGHLVLLGFAGQHALLRTVAGTEANGWVATDRTYSLSGQRLAERREAWDPEGADRPELSLAGDVIYARPSPGASLDSIRLRDPTSFALLSELALDGDAVADVVVIDRRNIFLATQRGLFRSDGVRLHSLRTGRLPIRQPRLGVDGVRQRVLSHGPDGYAVHDFEGRLIAARRLDLPLAAIAGFTRDGGLWQRPTVSSPLRVIDTDSGDVVSRYAGGDPTLGTPFRVVCVYRDRIVLGNALNEMRILSMTPVDD